MSEKSVTFTDDELRAICEFYSYGATRGNHEGPNGSGPAPGPLTPFINDMGTAVRKIWEARDLP